MTSKVFATDMPDYERQIEERSWGPDQVQRFLALHGPGGTAVLSYVQQVGVPIEGIGLDFHSAMFTLGGVYNPFCEFRHGQPCWFDGTSRVNIRKIMPTADEEEAWEYLARYYASELAGKED